MNLPLAVCLLVHILSQLGDEYTSIAAAIKVCDQPLSYPKLFDKLVDFERSLKEANSIAAPMIATTNYSQRQPKHNQNRFSSDYLSRNSPSPSGYNNKGNRPPQNSQGRTNSSHLFCQYCNIPGHETREFRKLARFLKDNDIIFPNSPVANATSSGTIMRPNHQSCLLTVVHHTISHLIDHLSTQFLNMADRMKSF